MVDSPRQGSLFSARELPRVAPAPVGAEVVDLAGRLPAALRLGTSSWSFPGWAGRVFGAPASATTLARHGLAAYARHPLLRCVGLDRTYYAPLSAERYAQYAAQVPAGFRFVVKAPELLTLARFPRHGRYGTAAGAANPRFLDASWARREVVAPLRRGLASQLGALLFQFPPQPPELRRDPARFAAALHGFLTELASPPPSDSPSPSGSAAPEDDSLPVAVEIRDPELLTHGYAEALAAVGAVHCLNVHPRMPELERQADLAALALRGPLVVRWMLGGGQSYESARLRYLPFDRLVDEDPETRRALAGLAAVALAADRPILIVINNKAEGSAPLSVLRLAEALDAALDRRHR